MKTVLVIVIVLAMASAILYYLRAKAAPPSPEAVAAKAELKMARADLKAAEKAHEAAVKAARSALKTAQKAYDGNVGNAVSVLAALNDSKGRKLGSYRGVTVFERWIATPHGQGPIAGTNASVDAQVSSRITATRLLAVGVFALAVKKKTGAIYLSIDSPALASIVECPVDDNSRARQFAVTIMNAARQATAIEAARPAQIKVARATLEQAKAATGPLEHARGQLSDVESDPRLTGNIHDAKTHLALVTAHAEQIARPSIGQD